MNTSLPIFDYKDQIVKALEEKDVVLIGGEPGTGKSTQVCQYLSSNEIADILSTARYAITVTEPRRMAAISLAERVAKEMNVEVGGYVGYNTGMGKCYSEDTQILFCTDGLQLVCSLNENGSSRQKILIIDEVHEWSRDIEALIAWAKERLQNGWNTKVVIMSATMESEELKEFFGDNTAIIKVPGRHNQVEFMQDSESSFIPNIRKLASEGNNILAFVPGKKEIEQTIEKLSGLNAVILPFHGELDPAEQRKCFESYNIPRIVIATSIAQTSLNIMDLDAVVDTGRARIVEASDGIETYVTVDISKADCIQRMGRVRKENGIYILCSNMPFEDREKYPIPEIQRMLLDKVVLHFAAVGIDATKIPFFHQPNPESIALSKELLIMLGAIKDDVVTELGHKMARIPTSARNARRIIEASRLGVVDDVVTIVSILERGTLVNHKSSDYYDHTKEESSDLLAELDVWNRLATIDRKEYAKKGINVGNYYKVKEFRDKLMQCLEGIVTLGSTGNREDIKKACIAGMIDRLYRRDEEHSYINGDSSRILDRKSCIRKYPYPKFVVGEPITIECENKRYGGTYNLDLIRMATEVDIEWLIEIAPQLLKTVDGNVRFEPDEGCFFERSKYYNGVLIESEKIAVPDHPDAAKLEEQYKMMWPHTYRREMEYKAREAAKQKTVLVNGITLPVDYSYDDIPRVYLSFDQLCLLKDESAAKLANGKIATLYCQDRCVFGSYKANNFPGLFNMAENARIKERWDDEKAKLPDKASSKKSVILDWFPMVGRIEITRANGGRGEPIYGYGALELKGNSIKLVLLDCEKDAVSKTEESLRFLFGREIESKYPEKKFMISNDGKTFFSTKRCDNAQKEFKSYVTMQMDGLSISNFQDRLEELEEIFADVTKELSA